MTKQKAEAFNIKAIKISSVNPFSLIELLKKNKSIKLFLTFKSEFPLFIIRQC